VDQGTREYARKSEIHYRNSLYRILSRSGAAVEAVDRLCSFTVVPPYNEYCKTDQEGGFDLAAMAHKLFEFTQHREKTMADDLSIQVASSMMQMLASRDLSDWCETDEDAGATRAGLVRACQPSCILKDIATTATAHPYRPCPGICRHGV